MKGSELKEFSQEELEQKAHELSEELFNLKIQHATGQLENTARIGQVKKDIARVNTFLNMKALKKEV
jgi:large subunit ribosomal protein L29